MSCRLTSSSVLLLVFLRVQSIHSTHDRSFLSLLGFEPPEIDGFPVDTCRIIIVPTPEPATTTTPTTTTKRTTTTPTTTTERTTTTPTTTTEITTTTPTTTTERTTTTPTTTTKRTTTKPIAKKQVVATTKKPAVQAAPRKPETKNPGPPIRPQPAPAGPITNSLLYYLLANSRGHGAGSLPGFNSFISQPMGGLPNNENRRQIGSSSSEDSSDES